MELQCHVQNYDWGKLGSESTVAQLVSNGNPNVKIDPEKPYAELWMGTHPSGPSIITERGILLSEYLQNNHDAIGSDVIKMFGVTIPFLFKVLSIRKALSIQAHPAKGHAEELHRLFPDMYKDPNHKPELAIALTPFEALCGFRPANQIKKFLHDLPELSEILQETSLIEFINSAEEEDNTNELKATFNSLMTCHKENITSSMQKLLSRLEQEDTSTQRSLLYPLVQRLNKDFPGDVGCYAPYFLNYLTLSPGQAIYLKPNLPHAYISGDCIECMACSDNVVRAGLTPKHIDLPTLLEMLDYNSYTAAQMMFEPQLEDEYSCVWRPPVSDFAVVKIKVPSGDSYNTIVRPSPSIIIITSGSGQACDTEPVQARPGVVLFLKASRQLTLTPSQDSHIEAYQAICNV